MTDNRPDNAPHDPTVGEVGERAVIATIRSAAQSRHNGDDAAVLNPASFASKTVCSNDLLVEGRHFSFNWSTPEQVGRRAVVQNFADIEAMGARPVALLLGLAIPSDMKLSTIKGIAEGIEKEASRWAAELVGGDVVGGETLTISVTALGELAGPAPALTIDRAAPNQTVIASGNIGHSAAGLALLQHFGDPNSVPDDPELQALVRSFCVPELERARGMVARSTGASSMTDISDGLIVDLAAVAEASGVTISLDPDELTPSDELLTAAALLDHDPMQWIFEGGEDHTLIGTTHAPVPSGFRAIGRVLKRSHAHADLPPVLYGAHPPTYSAGWASF